MKDVFEDVYWLDGLLVTAKHMQLIKRSIMPRVMACIQNITQDYWGVNKLEISAENITSGILEVVKVEAVNKDGTVVDFVGSFKVDLTRIKEDGYHKVYLATSNHFTIKDRYQIVDLSCSTESEDLDEENKPLVLKVKPSFLLKEQLTGQNTYMPILMIYANSGSYSLVDYTPPTAFVYKDSRIVKKISETVQSLNIKFKKIEDRLFYLFQHNVLSLETIDVSKNYQILSQCLTQVNLLLSHQKCLISQLFTAMATLYYGVHACLRMPIRYELYFEREDIDHSFYKILHFLKNNLDTLLIDDFIYKSLNLTEKGYFQFEYKKDMLVHGEMIFSVYGEKITKEWIEQAIIGGSSGFSKILSQRIVGIPRHVKKYVDHIKVKSSEALLFFVISAEHLIEGETYSIDMGRHECQIGYYRLV